MDRSDSDRPDWSIDGRDWPNRQSSRMEKAGGLSWHYQEMGAGPKLLLLHGTGAATHSFRDIAPLLAHNFHVVAPDLPGHGFTSMPATAGLSLDGMARLTLALTARIGFEPDIAVGHSAGAAILIHMTLKGLIKPRLIVAINGALLPIRGASLFSPLAKLLFVNPLAPRLFAWRASNYDSARRLLEGTGSRIDSRGVELYQRLFRKPAHVAATLGMMANWDLDGLQRDMRALSVPLVMMVGPSDKAVPPRDAEVICARVKVARVVRLATGGHLVHEEMPGAVAASILEAWQSLTDAARPAEDDL